MRFTTILCIAAMAISGCGKEDSGSSGPSAAPKNIRLSSSAFAEGQLIPRKHSRYGANISPALSWQNLPASVKEVAIIVDDPDAPGGTFTHWVIYKIPATVSSLSEGVQKMQSLPNGMVQGKNDFDEFGYDGPQPPSGTHHYHFKIYALDQPLNIKSGADKKEVLAAMKGHIVDSGELVGKYAK